MWIEYGFEYIIIRSPYTPYSVYLKGTIAFRVYLDGQGNSVSRLRMKKT